jgi:hypothetical protein
MYVSLMNRLQTKSRHLKVRSTILTYLISVSVSILTACCQRKRRKLACWYSTLVSKSFMQSILTQQNYISRYTQFGFWNDDAKGKGKGKGQFGFWHVSEHSVDAKLAMQMDPETRSKKLRGFPSKTHISLSYSPAHSNFSHYLLSFRFYLQDDDAKHVRFAPATTVHVRSTQQHNILTLN